MSLPKTAVVAFLAMLVNDGLLTLMVIFEAHYNAVAAGLMDVGGWVTTLVCSALAIEEIIKGGWKSRNALILVATISAANFLGTFAGVHLAKQIS